jgi:hypothetical protein
MVDLGMPEWRRRALADVRAHGLVARSITTGGSVAL